ncbi:MAG TPA: PilN domain-containing protein [Solirubrobacterales bacterium]|nr:PilN domain-containing protein [Solirubrobacterales bacterium]
MRPVNLIPPEQRRGDRTPVRAGPISYVIVAALGLALVAVVALVLTGNSITDRKAEISELQAREAAARTEAERLRAFADFASLSETRAQTVTSLAQSRFDWERILRELALVIPEDVWLTQLSGTAGPDIQLENAPEVATATNVSGPALSMVGCATSHEAVARFLQALKDIDGVTRVGIGKSERAGAEDVAAESGDEDCRTRDFIARFEIVATFDEVVVPAAAAPAAPAEGPTPTTGDGSGVAAAQAQEQAADSAAEQTGKAPEAASVVPGVAR